MIVCEWKSFLQAQSNPDNQAPTVRAIQTSIDELLDTVELMVAWVPWSYSIYANNLADKQAFCCSTAGPAFNRCRVTWDDCKELPATPIQHQILMEVNTCHPVEHKEEYILKFDRTDVIRFCWASTLVPLDWQTRRPIYRLCRE